MRLSNTIAAVVIILTTSIIATSTAFAAEVNIHADGTMRRCTATTSTWPDKILKGMSGEEAQKEIKNVDPSLETHVLPEDAIVTEDYREDRVRIFVDTQGKVVNQPQKG